MKSVNNYGLSLFLYGMMTGILTAIIEFNNLYSIDNLIIIIMVSGLTSLSMIMIYSPSKFLSFEEEQ